MKKLLIMAIAVIFASELFAQAPVSFGIKFGGNMAKNKVDEGTDHESRLGWNIGALANFNLNSRWSVQPELVYSTQGSKLDGGPNNDYRFKLDYLNMPVLVQVKSRSGFRVQTGPQVGLLLSGERESEANGNIEVEDWFTKADFGWTVGAGFVTASGFGIDVRHNFGITNIANPDGPVTGEWRNSVFQAGLFYQFGGSGTAKKTETARR